MKPPSRKRSAPEKLDPHPPGSKHQMMSARKRVAADRNKERDIKRKQRAKTKQTDDDKTDDRVDPKAVTDPENVEAEALSQELNQQNNTPDGASSGSTKK